MYNTRPERFLSHDQIRAVETFASLHMGTGIKRTYAIGDIHGLSDHLLRLLKFINTSQPFDTRPSRLVFLGDYIDRGKASAKVIAIIRLLQEIMPEGSVVALMGNHEHMLLSYLRGERGNRVYDETIKSFPDKKVPDDVEEWLMNLPVSAEDELHFYVHGGVDPKYPLNEQDKMDMIWMREPFLSSTKDFGKHIFHGHTPIWKVDSRENRTNVDTGAVFGNFLTAAEIKNDVKKPVSFFMVNESGAYWDTNE